MKVSIVLVRNQNQKDNFFNKFLYWAIWHGGRSYYNHIQLIITLGHGKYIAESTIRGFVITKTWDKWNIEQILMRRKYEIIEVSWGPKEWIRFFTILGNRNNANYHHYLFYYFTRWLFKKFGIEKEGIWIGKKSYKSTNCFQSVAYILDKENWHKATSNSFK